MNTLIVGTDKDTLLDYLPRGNFLVVDDGSFIDQLDIRAKTFDPRKHSLNPLKDISYRSACDFVSLLEAAFPGGDETLTKQNTSMQILEALLDSPDSLEGLVPNSKETKDAHNKLNRLLLSPILRPVLTQSPRLNFSLKGTVLARLNRAELGDLDCFFLGNLLASRYPGTVIIPDFGFYASRVHTSLIRQNRLIVGINSFHEVEDFRDDLLLIKRKVASGTTYEDAKTLADYLCPSLPHSNKWNEFIENCLP